MHVDIVKLQELQVGDVVCGVNEELLMGGLGLQKGIVVAIGEYVDIKIIAHKVARYTDRVANYSKTRVTNFGRLKKEDVSEPKLYKATTRISGVKLAAEWYLIDGYYMSECESMYLLKTPEIDKLFIAYE